MSLRWVREGVPWLDQVCSSEKCSQKDADAANHNVRNSEEWVAAAHHGSSGDDNGLGALVRLHGEVYGWC